MIQHYIRIIQLKKTFTFSEAECSSKGGVASGSCASGFGVCCVCELEFFSLFLSYFYFFSSPSLLRLWVGFFHLFFVLFQFLVFADSAASVGWIFLFCQLFFNFFSFLRLLCLWVGLPIICIWVILDHFYNLYRLWSLIIVSVYGSFSKIISATLSTCGGTVTENNALVKSYFELSEGYWYPRIVLKYFTSEK